MKLHEVHFAAKFSEAEAQPRLRRTPSSFTDIRLKDIETKFVVFFKEKLNSKSTIYELIQINANRKNKI